jgi:hypothetical protein
MSDNLSGSKPDTALAEKLNAGIIHRAYGLEARFWEHMNCDAELAKLLQIFEPALEATTSKLFECIVANPLAPHFGGSGTPAQSQVACELERETGFEPATLSLGTFRLGPV